MKGRTLDLPPAQLRELLLPAALLLSFCVAGCEPSNQYVPPPPPDVTVARPVRRSVTTYLPYTGTTKAVESVDLRARVRGFLESIHFKPGDDVKKNDLLFVIDPKPFQAKVDQAAADLASKEAQLVNAESEYKRTLALYQRKVISEQEYIKARATRDAAKADVEAAKATLESVKLDLGYCRVTAPIDGQISRNLVDVGNLVGDGQATLLATIVQEDPIYAYLTVSESDLLRFRKQVNDGKRVDYRKHPIPMGLGLANEEGYPHEGRVDYADPYVDPGTGTVQARAVFPNPEPRAIVPGLFVRLRVPLEERQDALLVPERALGADQGGRFVLVVNKEAVVERRGVTLGAAEGSLRVIEAGLEPHDLVVVNGLQRARPGAKVNPKPAEAEPIEGEKKALEPPPAAAAPTTSQS
jgi:RND family efflux transporter MFP subunit